MFTQMFTDVVSFARRFCVLDVVVYHEKSKTSGNFLSVKLNQT